MRRLFAFTVLILACATSKAYAVDRINYSAGLQPPSQWLLQESRFVRLGFGAFFLQTLNLPSYSNLTVSPVASSLTVQIGPTIANTVGSIYLLGPDDANPWGSSPVGGLGNLALSSDATQIALQGNFTTTTTVPGSIPVPVTASQTQITIVECNVTTTDQNIQSANFYNLLGIASSQSVPRDRVDLPACILKSGTAAATGSAARPTTDANYVAIVAITVPTGTAAITAGMIAATGAAFTGFATTGSAASFQSVTTTGNIAAGGAISATGNVTAPSFIGSGASLTNLPFTPAYNALGTTISTYHGVLGNYLFSTNSAVTVTLVGSAIYTNGHSFACTANVGDGAATQNLLIQIVSASSFIIAVNGGASISGQVAYQCWGT